MIRADHQHAAQQARQMPGQWVLAGTYGSRASAISAAFAVRTARLRAYQPAGGFEARHELTAEGADVWVRYTAPQPAAASPDSGFRESLEAGLTESLDDFSRRLEAARSERRP
ncbi:hypothetical protein [Streptomyces sp. G1]|uniref:hypothetical protein n=1 Tax=Streptomyces sp. G1 TaxID=361572 RepID=UPI00202EE22F|nr:hypothetical protein [Streptomyces sp. G1]MCM1977177.1 hypothetical protein [Streptomyces sp. G1]